MQYAQRDLTEKGLDEYVADLWKYKWFMLAVILLFSGGGVIYALLAPAEYISEAIIAPKEAKKSSAASSMLSSFGGLGGQVAAQLGIGGGSLDHIAIILGSRELATRVIEKYGLLQELFPDDWDAEKKQWKNVDSSAWPKVEWALTKVLKTLDVDIDKTKRVLGVGYSAESPEKAQKILAYYIKELNLVLKTRAVKETEANRDFLYQQLQATSDPILREKIQNMIASEIEKTMLIQSSSFKILEKPYLPLVKSKPKRKVIVIMFFLAGVASSLTLLLLWQFLGMVQSRLKMASNE